MNEIDPRSVVKNHEAILMEDGEWPNFHDAEIIDMYLWRGDVQPEKGQYVFPQITVQMELCALQYPFKVTFKFIDCSSVVLSGFNHQNPIMDLKFGIEERGTMTNGEPMTPYIVVEFVEVWEFDLSFKCFGVEVIKVEGR